MKMPIYITLASAALLSGCGGGNPTSTDAPEPVATETIRTCESIREQVIRLTEKNPVSVIKIYDPKVVKTEPGKVSCSGQAMLSTTKESIIYYRAYRDQDGDWMIEYNDNQLEK